MKFAIIIPTYNDATSITETLESVIVQSDADYSVAIVDDGSTDDTAAVVKGFFKKHHLSSSDWHYIKQDNSDQLNAIITGSKAISGDYFFILHSDDLLPHSKFLAEAKAYIEAHPGYQAYTGDLIIINGAGQETGTQKYYDYYQLPPQKLLTRTQLCLGRNQCVDFGFFESRFFLDQMTESYLLWNTPFWLDSSGQKIHRVAKMPFPILKYRVHNANYDSNYKGQLNVLNGELRTSATIATNFSIPCFRLQYFCYRIFNKIGLQYFPIYQNKPQTHKAKYFKRIIKQRLSDAYVYDAFMRALVRFYNNYHPRTVKLKFKKDFQPFYGKDNNAFNKLNLLGQLPAEYVDFIAEMEKGFNQIVVTNKTDQQKAAILCKFFCIHPDVKITIKE